MSIARHIPAATFLLQGGMVFGAGIYALVGPKAMGEMMEPMGFARYSPTAVVHGLSLQLLTMGMYFLLAAGEPRLHRKALAANTTLRLVAAYLFYADDNKKLQGMILYEILFAALNAASILFVETDAKKTD